MRTIGTLRGFYSDWLILGASTMHIGFRLYVGTFKISFNVVGSSGVTVLARVHHHSFFLCVVLSSWTSMSASEVTVSVQCTVVEGQI